MANQIADQNQVVETNDSIAEKEKELAFEKEKELALEKLKEGAIVSFGDDALEKAILHLEDYALPGGLLPLKDVIESGYVKETGFVWVKQQKETRHLFRKAGKLVSYGTEIKGFLEKNRLRELTGVKAKELFIWAPISDISIDITTPGKIFFRSIGGLGKMFPVEAFARGQ
ncbi:unnamed protein product [Calypogeia fissa]